MRATLFVQLFWLSSTVIAAPDCDPEDKHYYVMTSRFSGEYSFDLYVPPVSSEAEWPTDSSNLEWFELGCRPALLLVTDKDGNFVYQYRAQNLRFVDEEPWKNAHLEVFEWLGNGRGAIEQTHKFQTSPEFKYLGIW